MNNDDDADNDNNAITTTIVPTKKQRRKTLGHKIQSKVEQPRIKNIDSGENSVPVSSTISTTARLLSTTNKSIDIGRMLTTANKNAMSTASSVATVAAATTVAETKKERKTDKIALEQWSGSKVDQLATWIEKVRRSGAKETRTSSDVSSLHDNHIVNPSIFANNPIVARHTTDSRLLHKIVHDWIWRADNRENYQQHSVTRFLQQLRKLNELTERNERKSRSTEAAAEMQQKTGKIFESTAAQLESLIKFMREEQESVEFDIEEHKYTVNNMEIDRNVTTALEELFGTFNADQTIVRMLQNKTRWKQSKYYKECNFDDQGNELPKEQITERVKQCWAEKRDQGTQLHSYIESQYGNPLKAETVGVISSQTTPKETATTTSESSNAREASSSILVALPDQQQPTETQQKHLSKYDIAAVKSWEQIRMFNDWLLLASEYKVYDLECGIAGMIDAIYLPNVKYPRQVVLVDWKRTSILTTVGNMLYEHPLVNKYAKGNYWKYSMQLNIYREILEKNYGLHVIDMFIVSFPDNQLHCEVFGVPKMLEAKTYIEHLRRAQQQQQQQQRSNDKISNLNN